MFAFLGITSFFVFIIFGILFIVSLFRRKNRKRNAIITGVSFVLFISFALIDSDGIETVDDSQIDENKKDEEEKKDKEEQDKKDKEAKTKKDKEEQDKKDKEAKEKKDEEAKAKKDKEEQDKKDKEAKAKKVKEEKKYDDFSFAEYSVKDIKSKIESDTLHFKFGWVNQSGFETHFTSLGFFDVTQDGEILEESSGALEPFVNNKVHKERKPNVDVGYPIEVEYKILNNDKPIEIIFGSTYEGSTKTEKIKVEVK